MNKKFITLCVSALLAGGMVNTTYAAISQAAIAAAEAFSGTTTNDGNWWFIFVNQKDDSME